MALFVAKNSANSAMTTLNETDLVLRSSIARDTAIESGGDPKEARFGSMRRLTQVPFYSPPRQRKLKWDDPDHHVHKDWGDMFFDLFYVAAAYNLGNLLREDPTYTGLLYFVGCFCTITLIWNNTLIFDAQFQRESDSLWKPMLDTVSWLSMGFAVMNIRTVKELSHTKEYINMFGFSVSVFISFLVAVVKTVEIIHQYTDRTKTQPKSKTTSRKKKEEAAKHGNGSASHENHDHHNGYEIQESTYHMALYSLVAYCFTCLVCAFAAIQTGLKFFNAKEDESYRLLADTNTEGDYGGSEEDNVAIWFFVGSFIAGFVFFTYYILTVTIQEEDWTKTTTPINIHYVIHRHGEWIMLMLGETVLSLLVVSNADQMAYYKTFYCGIITIVLLEYIHFRAQPESAEEHAFQRGLLPSLWFLYMMIIYSAALIMLGASYKMLLFEFHYDNVVTTPATYAEESDVHRGLLDILVSRVLAGGKSAALRFDTDDRRERIAWFFSYSMSAVWLVLDVIATIHTGADKVWETFRASQYKSQLCLATLVKAGLIAWFATIPLYDTDPAHLALLGLVGVVANLLLVAVAYRFGPDAAETQEDLALERELEYTAARLRVASHK